MFKDTERNMKLVRLKEFTTSIDSDFPPGLTHLFPGLVSVFEKKVPNCAGHLTSSPTCHSSTPCSEDIQIFPTCWTNKSLSNLIFAVFTAQLHSTGKKTSEHMLV